MKTKYFIWMASIALLSSCTNEDELLNDSLSEGIVSASIEEVSSRVGFEYANRTGQFFWTKADAIGVYHGSKFHEYNLQGNGGTSSGDFKAKETVISGESQLCALYPYNTSHTVSGNTVSFYMNTEYTYSNEDSEFGTVNGNPTNVPMLAKIATKGSKSFTFGHLGGALCFKFINVPANAEKFVFTANSKITGVFDVNVADADPKITTSASSSDNTVTIKFTAKNETTTKVFYIPVPNGTYTGFTWEFLGSSENELKSYTTTTAVNTITDGKLLTITYTLDGSGTGNISSTASSVTELKNALTSGDDNIQLTANIDLTEDLNVSDDTTIDLNGQNLNTGSSSIKVGEGKTLNLTNNSTTGASRSTATAGISGSGDIVVVGNKSTVNIGAGVQLTSTENCCVFIPITVTDGATVTTAGDLTSKGGYAAIQANGKAENITVNINGGTIKSACEGVYFPCTTNLNIIGGTIEGTTAVYHKSGSLNITGGTLKGIGEKQDYVHNGNGCNATGDALVIEACDYPGGVPVVTISGGTFISDKAKAIGYYQQSDSYKLTNEKFITGGTFSDPSACYYLGNAANVTVNMNNDYTGPGFKTQSGQTVNLNISTGKKYVVTAPLVGSAGTQTLGFQFLRNSTVAINGGTITSSSAKMLINNYGALTLKGVTLSPSIPQDDESTEYNEGMNGQTYYVLSNNCGTTNIEEGTVITAPTGSSEQIVYAFDVCKYASYPNVEVNVKGGTINGDVEYTGEGEQQKLNVTGGTITGKLVVKEGVTDPAITVGASATVSDESWTAYKSSLN